MVYILTSTKTVLRAEVRAQESQVGDSTTTALLHLKLKQKLTKEAFQEQQEFLNTSAVAAFVALNRLDQRQRYRAGLNLTAQDKQDFNFNQGSSSSGLGYALALFEAWWDVVLNKPGKIKFPVFATGQILTSGHVKPIRHLRDKIESTCAFVERNSEEFDGFYICYPKQNDSEISLEQRGKVAELGGILLPIARLQSLLFKLLGKNYDGDPLGRWTPFKGLQSFDYEDSVRFFGRGKDIERLRDDLRQNNGLLIVSGASGTGKSSLIKAGLIPELERENDSICWAYTTPAQLTQKIGIVDYVLEQLYLAWDLEKHGIALAELSSTFSNDIEHGIKLLASLDSEKCHLVIYLDQFEEVFSQQSVDISGLLRALECIANTLNSLEVVIALRNEYLGHLLDNQALRSPVISNVASKLSGDSWYAIIHEQAAFSGISFESTDEQGALDKVIISEAVVTPFALPMVEFLLEQLYLKATEQDENANVLQYKHYQQLGGLNGAIAYRATQVLKESQANRKQICQFFDKFVGLNGESQPYAKHINLRHLSKDEPELFALVQQFIGANLIATSENDGNKSVKLVHDSLFENWKELKNWIESSKEYLAWRYTIDGQHLRWLKHGKRKNNLLKDKVLLKEGKQYQKHDYLVDKDVNSYLTQSLITRTQLRLTNALVTVILPLFVVSIYFWDHYRIKSYYYAAVGEKWSIPFGIGELTKEQMSHLGRYYRLDYQGDVLQVMKYQNSLGTLIADEAKENIARWKYNYTDIGSLFSVSMFSNTGKLKRVDSYLFTGASQAMVTRGIEYGKTPSYLKLSQLNDGQFSDISKYKMFFNDAGYLVKKHYLNAYDRKVAHAGTEVFGTEYKYDEFGLKTLEMKLDENDQPIQLKGILKIEFEYDDSHRLNKKLYFKRDEKLAYEIRKYDSWGNNTEIRYISPLGEPIQGPQQFSSAIIKYDEHGNPIESSAFDTYNQPTITTLRFFRKVSEYDGKGRISNERFFDHNGMPAYTTLGLASGVTSQKVKYDSKGNIVEVAYLDSEGKSATIRNGFSTVKIKFDSDGNKIEERYSDTEGNLTLVDGGYAVLKYKYNKLGQQTEIASFNKTQQPVVNQEGFHRVVFEHDELGNGLGQAIYGIGGEAVTDEDGIWKIQYVFDDFNRPSKTIALNPDGSIRTIFKNDLFGNLVESIFFDKIGQRANFEEYGVSKVTNRYDENRNILETAYYDINDLPVLSVFGFAKQVNEYDISGTFIRAQLTYDTKGGLTDPVGNIVPKAMTPARERQEQAQFVNHLKLSESGEKDIYVQLGFNYLFGIGVPPNISKARKWFLKSIENNASNAVGAMTAMGDSYHLTLDGISDYENAILWYRKAAKWNGAYAMEKLGRYHLEGLGTPKNILQGVEWLRKSANLGNENAQKKLYELDGI